MTPMPSGDLGNAVDRLQDEQWHILELFDSYTRQQQHSATARACDELRLATMIYTLLRVHGELEHMLLASLADAPGPQAVLACTPQCRDEMLAALAHAEASSPRDPGHVEDMAALEHRVRAWFLAEQQELFALARRSPLDLVALDRALAELQELLLCVGKSAARGASGYVLAGRP